MNNSIFIKRYGRYKYLIVLILLLLVMTGCSQKKDFSTKQNQVEDISSTEEVISPSMEIPLEKEEISMEEAISLGMKEAEKYYSNLYLSEVHSFDNDEVPTREAGNSGKRQYWYVDFANENLNYVSILIKNGNIENVEHFDNNGNAGLINLSELKMDSQEAAQIAQRLGLQGGDPDNVDDWVTGYNFKLSYASLVDSPDKLQIFLEVIGISLNGNFAHIDFDATSGEVLLAEEEIILENGNSEWRKIDLPEIAN